MAAGTAINRILALILSWVIAIGPMVPEAGAARSFSAGTVSCRVTESTEAFGPAVVSRRLYDFEEVQVLMIRAEGSPGSEGPFAVCLYEEEVEADGCHIWYPGEEGRWVETPAEEGIIRTGTACIQTGGMTVMICLPQSYEDVGRSVYRCMSEYKGFLSIEKSGSGLVIKVIGICPEGASCHGMIFTGRDFSPAFGDDNCAVLWDRFLSDGTARWLFEGYCRVIPGRYEPNVEGGYYLCPACFIAQVMAEKIGTCPEAPYLALACWDTQAMQQSEEGFWKTGARSIWLYEDYGIEEGFYDTRFNTDLIETGLYINEKLGGSFGKDAIRRYAGFYTSYAYGSHRQTESGGWLIPDYTGPGQRTAAHTSLNHQAAECRCLYRMAEFLDDPGLIPLADRLLEGILDTSEGWIREDHDLHYSVSAEGEFSGKDYERLTYDDLVQLAGLLEDMGRPADLRLTRLIEEKRLWMRARGIEDL